MDEKVGDDSQSDDDGFLSWSQRASCIMGNGNIERRASTVPHTGPMVCERCSGHGAAQDTMNAMVGVPPKYLRKLFGVGFGAFSQPVGAGPPF